jgi:hypothetical protein
MEVGDLVAFGKHNGVIVQDCTMMCSHAVEVPYRMGAMMVLSEGEVKYVVYANLRPANESR